MIERHKYFLWGFLTGTIGIFLILALARAPIEDSVIKMRPTIVMSHIQSNTLLWRVAFTNDTIIKLGPSDEFKFDFGWGNKNLVKELDENRR